MNDQSISLRPAPSTHQITRYENDFIIYQLYEASTNPITKKSRKRGYFILIVMFLLLAIFGYQTGNKFMLYYGLALTALAAIFGNTYIKWRHKNHYTKHVKNVYKNSFGEQTEIEILSDLMRAQDKTGSSDTRIDEIAVIDEIANHYFIKITTGHVLIVPKTNTALNEEIQAMIEEHNIPHVQQPDWKW